jgi:hypothetical protein
LLCICPCAGSSGGSVISRIESAQQGASLSTAKKLADPFEARAVFGSEFGPGAEPEPERELVVL